MEGQVEGKNGAGGSGAQECDQETRQPPRGATGIPGYAPLCLWFQTPAPIRVVLASGWGGDLGQTHLQEHGRQHITLQ